MMGLAKNVSVIEGDDAMLLCAHESFLSRSAMKKTLTWLKDGQPLASSLRFVIKIAYKS